MTGTVSGKLTTAQLIALNRLRDGKRHTALSAHVSLATLWALQERRLIVPRGLLHLAKPRQASWRITPAGTMALRDVEYSGD